jgi:hypothetical protein
VLNANRCRLTTVCYDHPAGCRGGESGYLGNQVLSKCSSLFKGVLCWLYVWNATPDALPLWAVSLSTHVLPAYCAQYAAVLDAQVLCHAYQVHPCLHDKPFRCRRPFSAQQGKQAGRVSGSCLLLDA